MNFPFDVLDYIFSFLKSHTDLVACSKVHPSFSQVAERQLYHHISIHPIKSSPSPSSSSKSKSSPNPYYHLNQKAMSEVRPVQKISFSEAKKKENPSTQKIRAIKKKGQYTSPTLLLKSHQSPSSRQRKPISILGSNPLNGIFLTLSQWKVFNSSIRYAVQ